MQGWELKKLDTVLKLEYGKPLPKPDRSESGQYAAYGANGIKCRTNKCYWKKPSIIVGRKGSAGETTLVKEGFWPLDVTFYVTFDDTKYDLTFLYHCLKSLNLPAMAKGVKPGINRNEVYAIEVCFPPLEEQKRIVAILDEVFRGIDAAIANTEKNLTNAKELFASSLDEAIAGRLSSHWRKQNSIEKLYSVKDFHSFRNEHSKTEKKAKQKVEKIVGAEEAIDTFCSDWINTSIGEVFNFIDYRGKNPRLSETGKRVFSARHIRMGRINDEPQRFMSEDDYKAWMVRGFPKVGDIFFVTEGHTMGFVAFNTRTDEFALAQRIITFQTLTLVPTKFFYYFMRSSIFQKLIKINATGAAAVGMKGARLRNLPLPFPSINEQNFIISKLDSLHLKTQDLEKSYQHKLIALKELKQSLLQKAFAGELTSTSSIETTSPEFSAQILAFAYYRHASKQRDKTYGRVKAQKILHLVESIGQIDLGRVPMKNAAGPNDSAHMRRGEDWAKSHQFFEFIQRPDGGYNFKKLVQYNELLTTAKTTIKPYSEKLDKIINLLLPMNSKKAELFATVHAAWNNLILDGADITDDAIIYEARENWHPDKMRISKAEFLNTIHLIRNKGLTPDGSAKRVGGQESLL